MSISDSLGKIKLFIESDKGKDVLVVIIVVLVGLCSFELGRLSKSSDSSGIKIEYEGEIVNLENQEANALSAVNTETNTSGKNFFASSKGSKYYSLGCSAGKSLKQENRVYFDTREAAEKAGDELSSSCK